MRIAPSKERTADRLDNAPFVRMIKSRLRQRQGNVSVHKTSCHKPSTIAAFDGFASLIHSVGEKTTGELSFI